MGLGLKLKLKLSKMFLHSNIIFSVNRFPCYGEAQECNMWEEKYQPGWSSSHDWQVFNILIISRSFAIFHTNISRFWPFLTNISTFIFKPYTGSKSWIKPWNYLYCIGIANIVQNNSLFRILAYGGRRVFEWVAAEICKQNLFLQVLQYVH